MYTILYLKISTTYYMIESLFEMIIFATHINDITENMFDFITFFPIGEIM